MMITAEMTNAETALQYGLVNYVVENKDDAMKKASELVDIIQRKAPKAVAGVIKSVNNFYRGDDEGFGQEIKILCELQI